MQSLRRFAIDFWPTMLVLAVIMYATLNADPVGADELPPIPHIDKIIHAIMMGGLTGAIAFDWQRRANRQAKAEGRAPADVTGPGLMWRVFAGVAVFGMLDEVLQGAMDNGRGFELLDYAADLAGALAAVFLAPPAIRKALRVPKQKKTNS